MVIPPHLASTVKLIRSAFSEGIPQDEYLPLLAVLYPFMADENLAEVASMLTGRDRGATLNDVYAAGAGVGFSQEAVARVKNRLEAVGLDEWSQENS
ncbi:DUF3349 domain-containing protein [Cystobacter ferrugineus]|uniref:DUF3349 domain-containing protein n=1 Tax=Cystobacter ferrugineus TaxID=83449 RepID=A0A1L9B8P8_9BACT|nr:DUF3349 domain-containing protein [Cystobacter ferrugineus]OJH38635.1 hypothetical protein BON30_20575 [Cystobacter ferrugineus]